MIGGDHPILRGELAKLTPAERVVLLVLWAHADERGVCWPSMARLSDATGYSYERVRSALRDLHARGIVKIIGRAESARPQYASNRLRLLLPDRSPVNSLDEPDRSPVDSPDRSPVSARPVTGDHQKNQEEPSRRTRGASRPARPPSPLRERAQAVLDPWWARQAIKPATPYIAALKVCQRALQGGMTDAELAAALEDVPTISGGALDFWRRRQANGRADASVGLTAEQHEAISDYRRRVDAAHAAKKRGGR